MNKEKFTPKVKNTEGWFLKEWHGQNGDQRDMWDLMLNDDGEQIADCIYGIENAMLFFKSPEMLVIVKAVAHIGVDFGFGEFELSEEHIKKARELYESINKQTHEG